MSLHQSTKPRLTAAQRRHLQELVADGPFWNVNGNDERSARVLVRYGYVRFVAHEQWASIYELTDAGREAVR